jgi:hypothetical protein
LKSNLLPAPWLVWIAGFRGRTAQNLAISVCRTKASASAGSATRTSSTSTARGSSSTPSRTSAPLSAIGASACCRSSLRTAHDSRALRAGDPGAGHRQHHTVQPKHYHLPDRRQAAARGYQGAQSPGQRHGVRLRQSYRPRRPARGDDGGLLFPPPGSSSATTGKFASCAPGWAGLIRDIRCKIAGHGPPQGGFRE